MTELESIMEKLTDKQARVLEFIRDRINRQGCPPTVREIARQFRFASTSTARAHLLALEKKGFLERSFHASRGIRLARELAEHAGLPIVGRVAAGTPILAIENIDGYLSTDSLFPTDGSCFCLSVRGDSMKDAGILDGDFVVVHQKPDFEDGEIGVAIIDGEATVKTLRRRAGMIQLVPANDAFEVTMVDPAEQEFLYAGEVIGVQRVVKRLRREIAS